jgi:hypothetical protein
VRVLLIGCLNKHADNDLFLAFLQGRVPSGSRPLSAEVLRKLLGRGGRLVSSRTGGQASLVWQTRVL